MRLAKYLLAALLSSLAVYLLVFSGEAHAEALTAIGVDLKPNVSIVICIQGLVVGLILGLRALFEKTAIRSR